MKHTELINRMTLEEKAALLSGKNEWQSRDIPRLQIPSLFFSDGPHGIRKQEGAGDHLGLNASLPSTCFPTAATVANSWDPSLGEAIGNALGQEARALGVDVVLGPGLNIKRSPLCGRNFEYFSEDPYLSGKMAAAYIRGIQENGLYACPKHFAVNSQELRRMVMNAVVDERTLRELYLTGFEIAVKEGGAHAVMSSYNEVNGVYANENRHLLQDILRGEWGFDGIVITDWGGSNDPVQGTAAGSNLEMPTPGYDSARTLVRAVKNGELAPKQLDRSVDHMLDAILTLSRNRSSAPSFCSGKSTFNEKGHHALARKAAAESAVLLKNTDHILPLRPQTRVAVIGDFAIDPRYQGAGSSMVNPTRLDTVEQELEHCSLQVTGVAQGYDRQGQNDAAMQKTALDLAKTADVVLYFFGLNELSEAEGQDRNHMRIPQNQIDLLQAIFQINPNIVGILSAGSAVEMPWHRCCKGLLHGYLWGQAGAGAILDILTGKINPSGRLAESYPLRHEDTPAFRFFPSPERNAEYREGLYVGYRYYTTAQVRVLFPFGYGLSYTDFSYSDLCVDPEGATFTLTNSGSMAGAEVPQLYVGLPCGKVFRPFLELKGFAKIFLQPGESRQVRIPFDDKTFRYWNVKTGRWEVEGGTWQICIGACVSDIRLTGTLRVNGTGAPSPYLPERMPSYYSGLIQQVEAQEFEQLLGYPVPSGKWSGLLGINDAICQMYYARSGLARFIYQKLTERKKKSEESGKPDLNILFIYNMPFRAIAKMTGGAVSMEMSEGMVLAVNGHFWKGLTKILFGYFRNAAANRKYAKLLARQSGGKKEA